MNIKVKNYFDSYLENKSKWWKYLNYKDVLNDPAVLIFLIFSFLFLIIGMFLLILVGIDSAYSSLIFLFFLLISISFLYIAGITKFKKIILCYEKENKPFYEYILVPKNIYDLIEYQYNLFIKSKAIKFIIKRNEDYYAFDQYDVISDIINPQELSDIHSTDALKRESTPIEKTSVREIVEKTFLLGLIGGLCFFIYLLFTHITAQV